MNDGDLRIPRIHSWECQPIYGMYLCFTVVCGKAGRTAGRGSLRTIRPTEGQDLMAVRRGFPALDEKTERQLCNGPSSSARPSASPGP